MDAPHPVLALSRNLQRRIKFMFDKATRKEIAAKYLDKDLKLTLEDLSQQYGESVSNITRALAEERVVVSKTHKTEWERQLLNLLEFHKLDNLSKLRDFITKAKANEQSTS